MRFDRLKATSRRRSCADASHAARDEVALGADTLSRAGVAIGDRVLVGGQDGQRKMRVVGQAVFLTDQDAFPLADGALVSFDAAAELGSPDSFDSLAIKFRPGGRIATERRLSKLTSDSRLATPRPPSEIEKLEQVQRLPQILAGFMVLLGRRCDRAHDDRRACAATGATSVCSRALGFRGRDVGMAVTWQAVGLAVVGGVLGLPAGILVGRFVWRAIADGIGVRPVTSLSPAVVAIIVPVTVLVAVLAALVPARRAARMHPTELLRSE